MAQWLRFQHQGKHGLGQVQGDQIAVYEGDLFNNPKATGQTINLADVTIDIPCTPSKMVAMVDNFHALVTKLEHAVPAEPLYFLKGNNSFLAANQVIRTPKSYSGKVVYEGELGIVSGRPDGLRDALPFRQSGLVKLAADRAAPVGYVDGRIARLDRLDLDQREEYLLLAKQSG
mgnify:CR=1 FL=1